LHNILLLDCKGAACYSPVPGCGHGLKHALTCG
jgi:hypothetical protein